MICANLFHLKRSSEAFAPYHLRLLQKRLHHSDKNGKEAKPVSESSAYTKNPTARSHFWCFDAFLVHSRDFKLKQNYQKFGPFFQIIFPFLMTMKTITIKK